MVRIEGLFHSYARDGRYAVEDVSFAMAKGETFGFLGPRAPESRPPRAS